MEEVTTVKSTTEVNGETTTKKPESSETFKENPTLKPVTTENTSESIDGKSAFVTNIIFLMILS